MYTFILNVYQRAFSRFDQKWGDVFIALSLYSIYCIFNYLISICLVIKSVNNTWIILLNSPYIFTDSCNIHCFRFKMNCVIMSVLRTFMNTTTPLQGQLFFSFLRSSVFRHFFYIKYVHKNSNICEVSSDESDWLWWVWLEC